jgi:hypothetical protein
MIGESSRYTLPATSGVSNATFPGLANKIYNASFSLLARMSTRGEFAVCSRRQSPTIPFQMAAAGTGQPATIFPTRWGAEGAPARDGRLVARRPTRQ